MSYNLLWMMNWAILSTFTLIDFRCPEDTRISEVPFNTLGQKSVPERVLGLIRPDTTRMSFLHTETQNQKKNK